MSLCVWLLTYLPPCSFTYSLTWYLPTFSLETTKLQPRLRTWPSCCLADRLQGTLAHGASWDFSWIFVDFWGKDGFISPKLLRSHLNDLKMRSANPSSCWFCMDELLEWTLNCMLYTLKGPCRSPCCSRVTYWARFPWNIARSVHLAFGLTYPLPLVIKHGNAKIPCKWRFWIGKITDFYGPFSSTPCLIK